MTCQLTLFDSKLQVFKPEWTIFGIFNQLLSTQNVNVARFARNVECDFFGRFSNTVAWNSSQLYCRDNFFFAFSGFRGGNLDGIKTVFIKGKELKAEKIFFQKSCLSLLIYLISGDL